MMLFCSDSVHVRINDKHTKSFNFYLRGHCNKFCSIQFSTQINIISMKVITPLAFACKYAEDL